MERKRPYWQVAVSLMFSILATAAFIILGVKAAVASILNIRLTATCQ